LTFDAIVADPPYGLSKLINKKWEHMDTSLYSSKKKNLHSGGTWAAKEIYKDIDWDDETPDVTFLLERNVPTIIFGGNYFPLPPSRKFIVWDKGEPFYRRTFAECELCYCSFDGNARIIKCMPDSIGLGKLPKVHPTQKPVAVMQFCISELPKGIGNIVCDPYMGSGTTGVACVNLGRAFIGIEQKNKYFDIACKRIEQAYMNDKNQFPEVREMIETRGLFE
jgi:site-specific DNA-methyltransferase (adenine-specific)/modification methylase